MKMLHILLISLCLLCSCQKSQKDQTSPAPVTPAPQTQQSAGWGDAPDFTLNTTDGKSITLSGYKDKVIILNFWATWCPPCRAEIPDFIELYREYKDKGLVILGVSLDRGDPAVLAEFIKSNNITYPVVAGNDSVAGSFGGIQGIPTTFIINRDGNIKQKFVGMRTREIFESEIKKHL